MNIGYSISKLNAKIESMGEQGGKAYCLDRTSIFKVKTSFNSLHQLTNARLIEYKDKLYCLGMGDYATSLDIYDGSTWTTQKLPSSIYKLNNSQVCIYDDKIHIFRSVNSSDAYNKTHFTYDGETFTKLADIPNSNISEAIVYKNVIYLLSNFNNNIYKWNSNSDTWSAIATSPVAFLGQPCIYNGEIHFVGGDSIHYSFDGVTFTKQSTGPTFTKPHLLTINNELYIVCAISGSKAKLYKFNDLMEWEEVQELNNVMVNGWVTNYQGKTLVFYGNNDYKSEQLVINDYIKGMVQKDTFIYAKGNATDLLGNLERVTDGFICKESGNISIKVGE